MIEQENYGIPKSKTKTYVRVNRCLRLNDSDKSSDLIFESDISKINIKLMVLALRPHLVLFAGSIKKAWVIFGSH